MAIHLSRLLTISRNSHIFRQPKCLTNLISQRNIKEFPDLKFDNRLSSDYVLILPEQLNETPATNELIRIPRIGEPEINISKITPEMAFKGLSQTICKFDDFITDMDNMNTLNGKSLDEVLKDIETHLYPMDNAFNLYMNLLYLKTDLFSAIEVYQLFERYYSSREKRFSGNIKKYIDEFVMKNYKTASESEKKLLQQYRHLGPTMKTAKSEEESANFMYDKQIMSLVRIFGQNLAAANQNFEHTIDDPDILAHVSPQLDDCQDLHHIERTPLTVTAETFDEFMKLCPDRFIRQNLWRTLNKRCSPKALPKLNNTSTISALRVTRRRVANLQGYRNFFESRLVSAMAESRQQVLDSLTFLNTQNFPVLVDRLQELADFADDNAFEDHQKLGIQEYDIGYWTHKYSHEILIGRSEAELKQWFPLDAVLRGMQSYFRDYHAIDLGIGPCEKGKYWTDDLLLMNVIRKGQLIGKIIYDPYRRDDKRFSDMTYARLRVRHPEIDTTPMRLASTTFIFDQVKKNAYLTSADIINLFNLFGIIVQRLLYKYNYYELNISGGLETDAVDLLPNLCVGHLLTDHRIFKACSDRGGNKQIDSESSKKIITGSTYFKPLRTCRDLYKSHLDLEVHTNLTDVKNLAPEIYSKYCPFTRESDNFDYCSMSAIFIGPQSGSQYASLWSKQLANYCLNHSMSQGTGSGMPQVDIEKVREFNVKLLDSLFDPEQLDTKSKLVALTGSNFEPTKTGLGVL